MPSSKTTVLGIRLDHDRRRWIEAEAARQGMSIRAYFERMIDEARTVGQEPVEPVGPIARESARGVGSDIREDAAAEAPSGAWSAGETEWSPEPSLGTSTLASTASRGLCDDLVLVAGVPCRAVKEALGLPRALINVVTRPLRRNRAF